MRRGRRAAVAVPFSQPSSVPLQIPAAPRLLCYTRPPLPLTSSLTSPLRRCIRRGNILLLDTSPNSPLFLVVTSTPVCFTKDDAALDTLRLSSPPLCLEGLQGARESCGEKAASKCVQLEDCVLYSRWLRGRGSRKK